MLCCFSQPSRKEDAINQENEPVLGSGLRPLLVIYWNPGGEDFQSPLDPRISRTDPGEYGPAIRALQEALPAPETQDSAEPDPVPFAPLPLALRLSRRFLPPPPPADRGDLVIMLPGEPGMPPDQVSIKEVEAYLDSVD